jgi:hypothetical protein
MLLARTVEGWRRTCLRQSVQYGGASTTSAWLGHAPTAYRSTAWRWPRKYCNIISLPTMIVGASSHLVRASLHMRKPRTRRQATIQRLLHGTGKFRPERSSPPLSPEESLRRKGPWPASSPSDVVEAENLTRQSFGNWLRPGPRAMRPERPASCGRPLRKAHGHLSVRHPNSAIS